MATRDAELETLLQTKVAAAEVKVRHWTQIQGVPPGVCARAVGADREGWEEMEHCRQRLRAPVAPSKLNGGLLVKSVEQTLL